MELFQWSVSGKMEGISLDLAWGHAMNHLMYQKLHSNNPYKIMQNPDCGHCIPFWYKHAQNHKHRFKWQFPLRIPQVSLQNQVCSAMLIRRFILIHLWFRRSVPTTVTAEVTAKQLAKRSQRLSGHLGLEMASMAYCCEGWVAYLHIHASVIKISRICKLKIQ